MMADLVVHPLTIKQLENFTSAPAHALMLVGPTGSGKLALATRLAESLLELPSDSFATHPYGLIIRPEVDKKTITIDAVRQMEQFLSLKVPVKTANSRVIIIEDAHLLGTEAQNALLKTLEEPPEGTLLILTVSHEQALLPTIRSRAATIQVNRTERGQLETYFGKQDHDAKSVGQAYAISGGLPGLMNALLTDEEHPLKEATEWARRLLSQSTYERLTNVDELSKQRQLAINVAFILQQMARVSLQTASGRAAKKWRKILEAGYEAEEALNASAQPKLVLTELLLNL